MAVRRALGVALAASITCLVAAAQVEAGPRSGLSITALSAAAGSGSVTVSFSTSLPTSAVVELGTDASYGLYADQAVPATSHRIQVEGLKPNTNYLYRVAARAGSAVATDSGSFATGGILARPAASTSGRSILLDGVPFFPIMSWGQCPATYGPSVALGVDLLLGGCDWHTAQQLLTAIAGNAYSVLPIAAIGDQLSGAGLIGWNQKDEADGFGVFPAQLPDPPPQAETGRITFLTLSAHFASNSDPPPVGKALYPQYFAKADVIGFDLYPLGKYCGNRGTSFGSVFDEQRELTAQLLPAKPTYQWIETGPVSDECPPPWPQLTPARLAAEVWLAIAGGATGIGYFTHTWHGEYQEFDVAPEVQAEIARQNLRVAALMPALLGEQLPTTMRPGSPVRVGARRYGDAVYVIAVNASEQPVTTSFSATGVGTRQLQVWGEQRIVRARRGAISDRFSPLAIHVYIAPPDGA